MCVCVCVGVCVCVCVQLHTCKEDCIHVYTVHARGNKNTHFYNKLQGRFIHEDTVTPCRAPGGRVNRSQYRVLDTNITILKFVQTMLPQK